MAKSPPYMPFYIDDWHGGTKHLTHLERACYLDLLLYQWANGAIPSSAMRRMALCGITDLGQWQGIWEALSDKFEPDDDGNLRNLRLEKERQKSIRLYEKQVAAGKQTAKSRWENRSPNRSPSRSPNRSPSDNQNQNQNHIYTHTHPEIEFQDEWERWLEYRFQADGKRIPPIAQDSVLMDLCRRGTEKARRDIEFSICKGAKNILDSDNDFAKTKTQSSKKSDLGL